MPADSARKSFFIPRDPIRRLRQTQLSRQLAPPRPAPGTRGTEIHSINAGHSIHRRAAPHSPATILPRGQVPFAMPFFIRVSRLPFPQFKPIFTAPGRVLAGISRSSLSARYSCTLVPSIEPGNPPWDLSAAPAARGMTSRKALCISGLSTFARRATIALKPWLCAYHGLPPSPFICTLHSPR